VIRTCCIGSGHKTDTLPPHIGHNKRNKVTSGKNAAFHKQWMHNFISNAFFSFSKRDLIGLKQKERIVGQNNVTDLGI